MLRWKDEGSSVPAGLQELVRKAKPARGMTEAEKIRAAARIVQFAATPAAAAPLLTLPNIAGAIIGIGGAAALLAGLLPASPKTEDCIPTAPVVESSPAAPVECPNIIELPTTMPDPRPRGDHPETTAPAPKTPKASPLKSSPHPNKARIPAPATNASTETQPGKTEATAPALPTSTPTDESKYINEAMAALSTAPADALSQLDEHAKLFPDGLLAEEREFLAIRVLVKLGRNDEARKRAKLALRQHKSGAYKTKIQVVLATIPGSKSK